MAVTRIELSQLNKGDVITFFYTSGHDQRPTTLYLNTYNNLIHAINLNYLSAGEITYLKTILSNKMYAIYSIDNPKHFYDQELKTEGFGHSYRTYKPQKMIQIYKIGYKAESLEKDAGLQKEKDMPINKQIDNKTIPNTTTLPEKILPNITTLPPSIFGVEGYK